jgi:hypothetical protein
MARMRAIDDFGTGYSSMAYLRQFPIDVLKIDRSFVSGIADTTESAALVHTLVQLGKVLGLKPLPRESKPTTSGCASRLKRSMPVRDSYSPGHSRSMTWIAF